MKEGDTFRLDLASEGLLERSTRWVIRFQQYPQCADPRFHYRGRIYVGDHHRQSLAKDSELGVSIFPRLLLREHFGSSRGQPDACVVVVRYNGLDDVVGEVEGTDGISARVADEYIGRRESVHQLQAVAEYASATLANVQQEENVHASGQNRIRCG